MTVIFPKWTNHLPTVGASAAGLGAVAVALIIGYWFSPRHTDVGYAPVQPVEYSHKLHAGLLGFDCRYCHQKIEDGPHATVPPTETCMNCHKQVKQSSAKLQLVRDSAASGDPIPWIKVHMLPDFAYFDHSMHVNIRGEAAIGCASCHGRIDQMEVVRQAEPLSMGWCLDCHLAPQQHLRPREQLTNMEWAHDEVFAKEVVQRHHISPPIHCSACHR